MNNNNQQRPFVIKDCALAAIATGVKAQNIKELRDKLLTIHPGSIYYHFWGSKLRPRFDDPEFNNDFASWARHSLHDPYLAERLGVIDPIDYSDIEALRQELIDELEQRLDESEVIAWADADKQFHFIRSQIVVFDTNQTIDDPDKLSEIFSYISVSSIFYHFIDGRSRFPEGIDDFRAWLAGFGDSYKDLCDKIAHLDPLFLTLADLRSQLATIFKDYFGEK